ncbi:G-type lectin S-receptor-like serine/threonine-protein kinase At4g27290 [Cornus florida]|uniref:G-type lectin S-receptor-like serine/threonine-protein kinase At4g27290 n=1 Tax=Cornus florida TaxID=4283 RepID=UPI0028A20D6B|nr:G-type lectin S-receptor-like serine/threonine-protein kinase At4g27290 [Cornus florida]XP_059655499.1 G-type lectin S-receptor-like serine/threonine-protein kinase At4g27290 [Cornus florida]
MSESSKNYGFTIILFLCSIFSVLTVIFDAVELDTITTTQSLTDGQTMVSSDRTFELGFFSPSGSSSRNRYLGIWYKKISDGTVVWVANRDTPLTDTSGGGVLKLADGGILVLINSTSNIFWSSSNSLSNNNKVNPVAQLLDSGNFVVRDSNDENFLWKSFDYPCDTLLPGMKLGKNLVTGIDRRLWSGKSSDDPSKGEYSHGLDLRGFPELVLRKGSIEQYRSGPWNGVSFSGSVGLKPNSIYTYHFVVDQQEVYYEYMLVNSSVFSRSVLNQHGIIQRLTWNYKIQDWTVYGNTPADNCDFYGLCQAYGSCSIGNSPVCGCLDKFIPRYPKDWDTADWSGGCVRRTPLDCHNGSLNGFLKYSGVKLPDTRNSWFNRSMTLKECETVCLRNCSCMAYANIDIRGGGSGCLLWFDDLIDIREIPESGQDIYIRMASSELESPETHSSSHVKRRLKIIVLPILLTALVLLGLFLLLYFLRRRNLKREGMETKSEDIELPIFDLETIANATKNFSSTNMIGGGGFGPVYKGKLKTGQEIAVKRLSNNSGQGLQEFKNEVMLISKLQHRNLVRLLGYCVEGEERMLIYEYMPNKSLDYFIFDQNRRLELPWQKRFEIAMGISRGLLYLHQDSRLKIIHRDLKASNILLDDELNPKISDFGIARSFGRDQIEDKTKRVIGTYGYMSPEYAIDGKFSVKSDVFSLGVLLLEIVSGKKNRKFHHPDHYHSLLGHAWLLWNDHRALELVDSCLKNSYIESQVQRCIQVGLLCVQKLPIDRPSMSSVVFMLGNEGVALPEPKQPGFFVERSSMDAETSTGESSHTGNSLTITIMEAR